LTLQAAPMSWWTLALPSVMRRFETTGTTLLHYATARQAVAGVFAEGRFDEKKMNN